jgi:hypothetical protein
MHDREPAIGQLHQHVVISTVFSDDISSGAPERVLFGDFQVILPLQAGLVFGVIDFLAGVAIVHWPFNLLFASNLGKVDKA